MSERDPIARGHEIADLAARQRGVVTRAQLLRLGLTRDEIDNWLRSARLHSLYRGVYLLGHPRPIEAPASLVPYSLAGRAPSSATELRRGSGDSSHAWKTLSTSHWPAAIAA